MSKRQITKRQSARMQKKQSMHRALHQEETSTLQRGLVIIRFAKEALIEDPKGRQIRCLIKPQLDNLVCGDQVLWVPEKETHGLIVSIFPRTSLLERHHPQWGNKPVAANITQLIITIAAKPEIVWPLLDSYLVMAEYLKLHPVIVLNKIDLPCETIKKFLINNYLPLGYDLIFTEKFHYQGYKDLQNILNHQVSIFVGQSGVGKSSLIAGILPDEIITTADITAQSELGKHATSNSRYYHLPAGGALIDSPGVRAFSLQDLHLTNIAQGYREFKPFLQSCKFRNCNHVDTPGCAIKKAVEEGLISTMRYENFLVNSETPKM